MRKKHSVEELVNLIKNEYGQPFLCDISFNIRKRDFICPDSITYYLSGFKGKNSLNSRIQYHDSLGAVLYNATAFYTLKDDSEGIIRKSSLGIFPSNELYSHLEELDFFENSILFAITFILANDPFSCVPEIYMYMLE